jgi:hypothetical protein
MAKVSVIIPARGEPYLVQTVQDVLAHATGDIEVIACLDGWWPDSPLPDDPRVHVLHLGTPHGLRTVINAGMAMATGTHLLKLDGHVSVSQGFDEVLVAACGETDLAVPAKRSLIPETWEIHRDPWHYFWLTYPWAEDGTFIGLVEKNYGPDVNAAKADIPVDEILTFQGSAWMIRKTFWDRVLAPMDDARYYFAHEAVELGMKTWLSGGCCRIVKAAEYGHLHKGKGHKRTFFRNKHKWRDAIARSTHYWMTDQWTARAHDFAWLVDRFGPLPGWPVNWQHDAAQRLTM